MNNNSPVFRKKEANPLKNSQVITLLFAIGLLIFFTITFTFSFKEKVLYTFFPRNLTLAEGEKTLPNVELTAQIDNSFKNRLLNVAPGSSNITLKWKTGNNPISCTGSFWSNTGTDEGWAGSKSSREGSYKISQILQNGIYVYSINCQTEVADSSGSTIIINVGSRPNNLQPSIISLQVIDEKNQVYDIDQINQLPINSKAQIVWSSLNTDTPFSVCVASGSWPAIYQNTGNITVRETVLLDKSKTYQYKISCSNEYGYDSRTISFQAR